MLISKPNYFDSFRCIGGSCPDSCCKEWGVQVDAASAAYYRALPGALGDKLRSVLVDEDGETVMTIENGRCPMWRADGLCRIQAELGEAALCKVCTEFPRLTHDYGDFVERTLELSCPEAARLILSALPGPMVTEEIPGGEDAEYDEEAMAILKSTRDTVLQILADPGYSVPQALALALLYGYQAQAELDGEESQPFDADAALDSIQDFLKPAENTLPEFYLTLEILTESWKNRLLNPAPGQWCNAYRNIARYFVERYWIQAVSDYDLYSRVKFAIVSCLLIRQLGGDLMETAQLYSKEIENDADNVDAILDAAYSHPAFTDDKLLSLLINA